MKKSKSAWLVMSLISVYLLLPLFLTLLYSFFTEWNEMIPRGFTFKFYLTLFSDSEFIVTLARTVFISILPIIITTVVILLAMFVIVVYKPHWDKYLQIACTLPYAMQGVILAISVLSLYVDAPQPLSNRFVMLTGTYCIIILPYMYQGIRNSLTAVKATMLIEAAQMLGANKLSAYFRIVVPNILSGVTISAMLSAAIIFGDFVIVNTIGGNYFVNAQMYLSRIMFQSGQLTSAVIMVLFVMTFFLSLGVFRLKNKDKNNNETEEG
jgi:putative spermidine/putrescine transport system permease protein